MRSVGKFDTPICYPVVVTRVKDLIYILCFKLEFQSSPTLRVHEGSIPHDLLLITAFEEYQRVTSMVWIEKSSSLYFVDSADNCIWKMDIDSGEFCMQLCIKAFRVTLSLASNNLLLVLSDIDRRLCLSIYDEEFRLVRNISLPNDFTYPLQALQRLNGEFIVSHSSKENYDSFVSVLCADGQIIRQFWLLNSNFYRLLLDSDGDTLLLVEGMDGSIELFDSNTGNQKLIGRLRRELTPYYAYYPRLYYDGRRHQLIVPTDSEVEIFTFSET